MKVVSPQQMKKVEEMAYRDGASESDFMEEAGSGIALVVHDLAEKSDIDRRVILLCGKGNNGGDAYVAGIHLLHLEYEVIAYQLFPTAASSFLCEQSRLRFLAEGGRIVDLSETKECTFPSSGIIVDGIFGTGFRGEVDPFIAEVISKANDARLPIVAIDIPSGLNGETGIVEKNAIIAQITAFLGLPKTGFFLENGWDHVGRLAYVDFGLPQQYLSAIIPELIMLTPDLMKLLLPPVKRSRHKYQAGYVVGLAGSPAMPGAAFMACTAALRSGAGVVRLLYKKGMEADLISCPYELLRESYDEKDPGAIWELMNQAGATFIGPGIGVTEEKKQLLRMILPRLKKSCVIDADALTILADLAKENLPIPQDSILTPHLGEMKRLLKINEATISRNFLNTCSQFAESKKCTVILKGGPSFLFHPQLPILVNARGDPGMATAGSGDVLTGLIASLLAQGLSGYDAAALGVYLHSVAGEIAAEDLTSYCMIASDIVSYFPDAFASLGA